MEYLNYILTIVSMLIIIIALDFIWLGIIIKDFIINQFGSLVKVSGGGIEVKVGIGILTWTIIAAGCFFFATLPSETLSKAFLLGAGLGFLMYSVYDLTNLTFIQNYPVKFIFIDIAWGTFLCSVISGAGFIIKNFLARFI